MIIPHSQPYISKLHTQYVAKCLSSKMLSNGAQTIAFENEHANLINKKFALATNSGTQALIAILNTLNIKKGDEVILPSYVCNKVASGILYVGAKPVFCDIGNNWVMNTQTIEKVITPKTKAIVLVHIFGINAWENTLAKFNLPIIEDICQALGSNKNEPSTGAFSDFAFTSFHGTKVLPIGQGGMAFCNNANEFEVLKNTYNKTFFSHFSDLQAAIGLAHLTEYKNNLKARFAIANQYFNEFPKELMNQTKELNSMFFRFPILSSSNWESVQKAYLEKGILVKKGVDSLSHTEFESKNTKLENTIKTFNTTVSIPILPQFKEKQINLITKTTKSLFKKGILNPI